ncbi:hypothetical protein [Streptomyces sp. XD-27]|uniref:hypothetical protein n=1 Tax=Streptomyces sp. XD-27 TaxID=3062779 RepID=UPI0026F40EF2|nr:hypothetical protein [Streptomyces sp. XD-27]WKX69052.1 hypothetical protein Q3Y56_03210 [Streptomyces sp. XD-27]
MSMTSTTGTTRLLCVLIPLLLLLYGVLRLIDGMDGDHGPGVAWNVGHTFFLVAFLLLGAFVVMLRSLIPAATIRMRTAASAAMVAGVFGAGCFVWVILGDLFSGLAESAPLPGPLEFAGPMAFQLGILTLLIMTASVRPRLLPVWSPALVFVSFILIAVSLDLIPLAAVVLMAGLTPLARSRTPDTAHAPASEGAAG